MKRSILSTCVAAAAIAASLTALPAFAVPTLQLSIAGGSYDSGTQTIVTSSDTFTLSAYWSAQGRTHTPSPNSFYVSVAVLDENGNGLTNTSASLGSIVFNGTAINVTSDMVYGVPPLDSAQGADPGDLASHGIYETFFYQSAVFAFDTGTNVGQFDTEDCASLGGANCTPDMSKIGYRKDFLVDATGLADGYKLHFDLYSTKAVCPPGKKNVPCVVDTDINDFAPFSHDAEFDGTTAITEVPEPASIALLGAALIGVVTISRRHPKQ